jgi:hypothetical protein
MAERTFAWVPIEALRALVEYADLQRGYADQEFACGRSEQEDSDAEFQRVVHALGVEELDH